MTLLVTSLPVARWLERPIGVTKGHGFDSRRGLRFFFVPLIQHLPIQHLSCEISFYSRLSVEGNSEFTLFGFV